MRANVDVSTLVVRYDQVSWPFRLDLDRGSASIELHGSVYEVCPLSWRAKMRLARFAHMDQQFIQARFLEACIHAPKILPGEEHAQAVLMALATWINLSSGETPGLPLDQGRLAAVTVDVCRALRVGPMAFSELTASEVELLWLNLDQPSHESEVLESSDHPRPSRSLQPLHAQAPQFDTKIVVVPDQSPFGDVPHSEFVPQSELEETASPVEDVESLQPEIDDEPVVTAEQVLNETIPSNGKTDAPDRNARGRFRVSIDKPLVKPERKPAAILRVPLKQSRPAPRLQVPTVGEKEFVSDSAPAADADHFEEPTTRAVPSHFEIPSISISTSPSPSRVPVIAPPAVSRALEFAETDETASAPQAERVEWMLDEFCERLAEAAADLGILEEV